LDTESGSVDSLLQTVESTEILVNLIGEGSRRRELSSSVRGRGEVLPEERVVDVSSTVELDGGLESDRLLDVLSLDSSREFLRSLFTKQVVKGERDHARLRQELVIRNDLRREQKERDSPC